jgi:hypothetical protein
MKKALFSVETTPALISPTVVGDSRQIISLIRGKTALLALTLKDKSMDDAQQIADFLNENVEGILVALYEAPEELSDGWLN